MTIQRPAEGWPLARITIHPGVVLSKDFLGPMAITANQLAVETKMPSTRIGEIVHGRRGISPDTALRLARFFGTSAEFWLNLQAAHDLSKARLLLESTIRREVKPLKAPSVLAEAVGA